MNKLLSELYDNDVEMRVEAFDYGSINIRFKKGRYIRPIFISVESLSDESVSVEEKLLQELRVFLMSIIKLKEN